jgi:hypothetical protein
MLPGHPSNPLDPHSFRLLDQEAPPTRQGASPMLLQSALTGKQIDIAQVLTALLTGQVPTPAPAPVLYPAPQQQSTNPITLLLPLLKRWQKTRPGRQLPMRCRALGKTHTSYGGRPKKSGSRCLSLQPSPNESLARHGMEVACRRQSATSRLWIRIE